MKSKVGINVLDTGSVPKNITVVCGDQAVEVVGTVQSHLRSLGVGGTVLTITIEAIHWKQKTINEPEIRTVYACGYHRGEESYGMFAGPFPNLDQALESVPDEPNAVAYLFKFVGESSDILYRWSNKNSKWRPIRKSKKRNRTK